jgi:hypothetical protein
MIIFEEMAAAAAEDVTCMLCSYVMIDPVQLPYCSHAMCRACVQLISRQNMFVCPMRCTQPAGCDAGVPLADAAVQALPAHARVVDQINWHAALVLASGFDASALKSLTPEVSNAFVQAGLQNYLPKLQTIAGHHDSSPTSSARASAAHAGFFDIDDTKCLSLVCSGHRLQPSERLRVSVRRHSANEPPAFAIWAERKSSKEQWELDVDDVTQHCDTAVPAKVVLSRLKVSSARVGARACAL